MLLIPSGPGLYQVVGVELVGERPDTLIVHSLHTVGERGRTCGWPCVMGERLGEIDGAVEIDGQLHDAESLVGWIISAWQSGSLDAVAID